MKGVAPTTAKQRTDQFKVGSTAFMIDRLGGSYVMVTKIITHGERAHVTIRHVGIEISFEWKKERGNFTCKARPEALLFTTEERRAELARK